MSEGATGGRTNRLQELLFAATLAIGAYAIGNVVLVVLAGLVESAGVQVFGRPDRLVVLGTVALQGIGFGGAALAYLYASDDGRDLLRVSGPSARVLVTAVVGYLLLFAAYVVLNALYTLLSVPMASSDIVQTGTQNPELLLLLVPMSILIVGPGEELLYRGVIQGRLRAAVGPRYAIVATSALFAPIHVFGLTGSTLGVLTMLATVFFLSLFLGAIYEYTGNLVVPALVHGLYNATQFVVAYLQVTGGVSFL
jgi:hypothetical protein